MTVKEVIKKLKTFDPDLKVGKTNSFGDFLELDDIWMRTVDVTKYSLSRAEKFIELDIDADIRCDCN